MCTPGHPRRRCASAPRRRCRRSMVVREDSLTLFGFADDDEKQMFELVQTASGVGPKLAQAMLAVHRPEALRRAVSTDDVKTLTTVPGIGQKGAQRIILELRDRIGSPTTTAPAHRSSGPPPATGRRRCRPGWSGSAGPPRRPTRPSSSVAPEAEQMATPDVAAAAPRRPAHAEQGVTGERVRARGRRGRLHDHPARDRGRRRRRRARRRGRAAPAHPGRGRRPGAGPRTAVPAARGGPGGASACPTTC